MHLTICHEKKFHIWSRNRKGNKLPMFSVQCPVRVTCLLRKEGGRACWKSGVPWELGLLFPQRRFPQDCHLSPALSKGAGPNTTLLWLKLVKVPEDISTHSLIFAARFPSKMSVLIFISLREALQKKRVTELCGWSSLCFPSESGLIS